MASSSDNIRRMMAKAKQAEATRKRMAGLFGKAYDAMPWYDKAALYTSPVPVLGDIVGLGADTATFIKEPTWTNASLGLAGLLPWIPSAGITKTLGRAVSNVPNDLPLFYNKNKMLKLASLPIAGAEAVRNIAQARYNPTARGLFKEQGVSVADTRAAKKAMKEFKQPNVDTQAGKKPIGMFRQSTMFKEQYGQPSKFHDLSKGTTEVGFDNLGVKEYTKMMDGATGLKPEEFNDVFSFIKKIQNVDPDKNYRMTVRRTNTSAAGNLDRYVYNNKIFGGQSLKGLKNIFNGKQFKTNKDFLKALQDNKKFPVKVLNPEEVLKGKPAIVTGSVKSDARELGGVNYMTAIKKDGTLVSFMNDEHDLFKLKAPSADRMLNISTPITVDILDKGRLNSKMVKSKKSLEESRQSARTISQEKLSKYKGVDTTLPTPPGMTKEQFYAVQALANMKPTNKDYSRVAVEAGMFAPGRAFKPLGRTDTDPDRMIEYENLINQLDLSEGGYGIY